MIIIKITMRRSVICAIVTYLPTVTPQFSVSLAVSAAARTDGKDMRSA